jgi:hypothetical protein
MYTCDICYVEYEKKDIEFLGCGHFFCKADLTGQMAQQINDAKIESLVCATCQKQIYSLQNIYDLLTEDRNMKNLCFLK